jgi:TonB-dependent SusC/RagA subfamily outer membrane receptor
MVIIDGAKSTSEALTKLDRASILKVEILKGAAAAAAYGDDGRGGVIIVTTKTSS